MFLLNGSNYTDGKATMRSADGSVVHGGSLRIYRDGTQISEATIGQDGKASFDVVPGTLYVFEVYDSDGTLVSVLDPVLYERLEGGDGGSQGDDGLMERVAALEAGLADERAARSDADYAASLRIGDCEEQMNDNSRRIGIVETHPPRTDNPHHVTAAQVGAATPNDLLNMRYAETNTLRFYRGVLAS